MDIGTTFIAGAESAELTQPDQGAFDDAAPAGGFVRCRCGQCDTCGGVCRWGSAPTPKPGLHPASGPGFTLYVWGLMPSRLWTERVFGGVLRDSSRLRGAEPWQSLVASVEGMRSSPQG
jgi:hypothetical protein